MRFPRSNRQRATTAAAFTASGIASLALILSGCIQPIAETSGAPLDAESYGRLMASCLSNSGWNAWATPSGVEAEYEASRESEFRQSFVTCESQIGASQLPEIDEATWSQLHADYVEAVECLIAQGVNRKPPLELSEFQALGLGGEYAYKDIETLVEEPRIRELEELCPQPEVQR